MIEAFAIAGLVAILLLAVIGAFTLVHLLRPKKAPADTSNRINHVRLWWFALTREDKFVSAFPWMARDEFDNVG